MAGQASKENHVNVNGVRLSYRESGQGDPLVLVHGHISDQRSWFDLESKLATRFHVYNYSRRFAWPNEPIKDDERAAWEQDSRDLAFFIEGLNIAPVHVLANSSGAVVTLCTARDKPHLFRTLMLEEPPLTSLFLSMPPTLTSVLIFLLKHPVTFWPVMYFGATTLGKVVDLCKGGKYAEATELFSSGVVGPRLWPGMKADPERMKQVEDNSKWLCQFFRHSTLPKYSEQDAKDINVPTMVMVGGMSDANARWTATELFRLCGAPRKMFVSIDRAGHLMHEDNPQHVFEEVVRFVLGKAVT